MRVALCRAALALLLAGLPFRALAADTPSPLGAEDCVRLSLERNPRLVAAGADLAAAQSRRRSIDTSCSSRGSE